MSQPKDFQEAILQIQFMMSQLTPDDDYTTVFNAEEDVQNSQSRAKKEIEELTTRVKGLQKTYESALAASKRPSSVPSVEAAAATLHRLDKEGLALAKGIQEREAQLTSKEEQLAALKGKVRELEALDPAAEHLAEMDGTPVRLELFRGLGFESVLDKNNNLKVYVSSESGDVHSVASNDRVPPAEKAKLLWKVAAS